MGDERQIVRALLAAIEDRARAADLPDSPLALTVARRHRLTPLLSIRCRGALPDALEAACRRDHVLTVARHLALGSVAEECVAALAAAGVGAAILKGLAYERTLYEQPGARPTSDVDLLVRDPDRRIAFDVLSRLGFEPRAAAPGFDDADYHEVAWRRDDVEIDLHMGLAPLARCAIDYGAVWREAREIPLGAARAFVLAPPHAVIFHALHMAIDHFDVPAIYLIDLSRLAPTPVDLAAAAATARAWRCERPLATSLALVAAFLSAAPPAGAAAWPASRVVARYGEAGPLPRPEQLLRKFAHFDTATDAVRYTTIQARRSLHDLMARRLLGRSPRDLLKVRPSSPRGSS